MFLYTNPVWPDNCLLVLSNNLITLTANIFEKAFWKKEIPKPMLHQCSRYQDSQMNWHLEWEFIWCQPRGRWKKSPLHAKISQFWRLWTSLDGRRKICYKNIVLSTVGLWINVYAKVIALTQFISVYFEFIYKTTCHYRTMQVSYVKKLQDHLLIHVQTFTIFSHGFFLFRITL